MYERCIYGWYTIKCGIARNVTCVDIWPATWRARKLERRDSEDEESVIDLEEKEKPMKKEKQGFVNATGSLFYNSNLYRLAICDTATSPSAMTHHVGPHD